MNNSKKQVFQYALDLDWNKIKAKLKRADQNWEPVCNYFSNVEKLDEGYSF